MSWGTCYSGSNNIHFNSPPLMSDGRNFSSWKSSCSLDEEIKKKIKIDSNWEYRQYLTQNTNSIMKHNLKLMCDNCCKCSYKKGEGGIDKYLFSSCSDNTAPFGYQQSDLKNLYLSKQELNSKLRAPILTQEQYLKLNQ